MSLFCWRRNSDYHNYMLLFIYATLMRTNLSVFHILLPLCQTFDISLQGNRVSRYYTYDTLNDRRLNSSKYIYLLMQSCNKKIIQPKHTAKLHFQPTRCFVFLLTTLHPRLSIQKLLLTQTVHFFKIPINWYIF